MSNGWISIHRQLLDHWLWEENREFSKAEAWIDILLNVNHTPKDVVIKSKVYKVNRGESIMSLDSWGKRWKWNKSKVRRFLNLLQEQSMIELKNETQTTRLTVCKYDSYQVHRNANETKVKRKRNANETQMTPNNNDNNDNKENKYNLLLDFVNGVTDKKYRAITNKTKGQINARIKEGYKFEDFKNAITNAANDKFHKQNNYKYLTLEYVTRAEQFDKWLNNGSKQESTYISKPNYLANYMLKNGITYLQEEKKIELMKEWELKYGHLV